MHNRISMDDMDDRLNVPFYSIRRFVLTWLGRIHSKLGFRWKNRWFTLVFPGKIWSGLTSNEKNSKNRSCLASRWKMATEKLPTPLKQREMRRVPLLIRIRARRDPPQSTMIEVSDGSETRHLSLSVNFGFINPAAVWSLFSTLWTLGEPHRVIL